jgi:hypothetical protein
MGSLIAGMVDFPGEVFMALRSSWTDPGDKKLRRAITAAHNRSCDSSLSLSQTSEQKIGSLSGEHDRLLRTAVIPATDVAVLKRRKSIERILSCHPDNVSKYGTPRKDNHHDNVCQKVRKQSPRKVSLSNRRRWQRRSGKTYLGMVKPLHLIAAGKDILGIMHVALNFPTNFMMSLARGVHNAPLIYGDETVRQASHVTNLRSGLRAAANEFGYGFFDGISGLVTQPLSGIKQEGAEGLLKGIGKAFGGLIIKPASAVIGLPTYTIYGLRAEARKIRRRHFDRSIIVAHTAQGYEEWQSSTPEERIEVVRRWASFKSGAQTEREMTVGLRAKWAGKLRN